MKIAIVNPEFTMGGAQTACVAVANGLAQYGTHEVFLVDFLGKDPIEHAPDPAITMIRNQYNRSLVEKIAAAANKIIFKYLKREYSISKVSASRIQGLIQIIQKHEIEKVILSAGYLTAMIPILKKTLPHVQFIAWQHSTYEIYTTRYTRSYSKEYFKGLEVADAIVCLTKIDAEKFSKHNTNSQCIYNPLTLKPSGISTLEHNNLIFVGRLDWETKGLIYLGEIMERLNSKIHLTIVGDGPDREKLENSFKERGILERIKFIGPVKQSEVSKYYEKSDIVISTSKWEGFGLTLVEGMACGLPVVAFDNNGPNEILNRGEFGFLIEKYDTEKFSAHLKNLLQNKEKMQLYQKKSLARAKDFKVERIIENWSALLES